jgi:hypothetical protein
MKILGMDEAFWVAVSLAYLEFQESKEALEAAQHD